MNAAQRPFVHGVVETVLYTDDLGRATAFYRDVLGLAPVRSDGDRFQAFDAGDGRMLLLFKRGGTLQPMPAPEGMIPPHDGRGPVHVAFAVAASDLARWRAQLARCGVPVESEAGWERGGRSLYLRDPDGALVELVTPGIWPGY